MPPDTETEAEPLLKPKQVTLFTELELTCRALGCVMVKVADAEQFLASLTVTV